jgi:hypothetical protein
MNNRADKPARNSEPTDSQLHSLMRLAADDARIRGAEADRALNQTIKTEVQKVRERYLSAPRPTLSVAM